MASLDNTVYCIRWTSKVTGVCKRGTRTFPLDEATLLAAELNHDYPHIEYVVEPVPQAPASSQNFSL